MLVLPRERTPNHTIISRIMCIVGFSLHSSNYIAASAALVSSILGELQSVKGMVGKHFVDSRVRAQTARNRCFTDTTKLRL